MHATARETTTHAGSADDQPSGLLVVHGNRAEDLLALAMQWTARWPLAPLEMETWLVPSQGVAQWVRQTLAAGPHGIAASLDLRLPAQWLWHTYRVLLGEDAVSETAALDEGPMTWRVWRLLPVLCSGPDAEVYAPLARYLADDPDGRRRGQLARRLADLYDQYQVYRADWLRDWAAGHDQIGDAVGHRQPLPDDARWQAHLWRAVRQDALAGPDTGPDTAPNAAADTGSPAPALSRADWHAAFVAAARRHPDQPRPAGLPRRLTVFGLSGLPPATLEALALVSRWSQVLVCVLNPCRYHWADMVPDAVWLARLDAHWRARQARRPGSPPQLAPGDTARHGHPLLAAWGRQGRDFIALLQAHEERPVRDRFDAALQALGQRVDLFASPIPAGGSGSLLAQLQDDILHGRPLHETRDLWPPVDPAQDASLRFHICHTALREVETLHDRLLAALHRDPTLQPRDILVMVPDVATYAPLVHDVFGRLPPNDPRHIPYAISDAADATGAQLVALVRGLCALPRSRLALSEVLGWLDIPAFARRFGFTAADLETLARWLGEAGVRWGLDAAHRQRLGLVAAADGAAQRLTWRDGLRRLWLGYATGPVDGQWQDHVPAHGVAPLEAPLLARLQSLLDALERHAATLETPASAAQWRQRLQALLDDCLALDPQAPDPAEWQALQRLRAALTEWADEAAAAGDAELPVAVVADAWLARATPAPPGQRFLAGAVTIATLLPMRAVPFRHIHILGLHDGAYPRRQPADDFDLMATHPRPGDRQRRHEDHYLFLEALLSARECLTLSWVGRSALDDRERAASVLVDQLRDHLAAGWRLAGHKGEGAGPALLEALTTQHRLQPFDAAYFQRDATDGTPPSPTQRWFSYAHEWLPSGRAPAVAPCAATLPPWPHETPIDLRTLTDFLRHPARAFYRQRLRVDLTEADAPADDSEPFDTDGLTRWRIDDAWVRAAARAAWQGHDDAALLATCDTVWQRAVWRGLWPAGAVGVAQAGDWRDAVPRIGRAVRAFRARYPARAAEPVVLDERLDLDGGTLHIRDAFAPPYAAADGERAVLVCQGSALVEANGPKSGPRVRHHKLLEPWVQHLAHHRAHGPVWTWVLSPRGLYALKPLPAEVAEAAWRALATHWLHGMAAPCPLPPEVGVRMLQHLQRRDGDAASAWLEGCKRYDGDEYQAGVRDRDAYWRLAFPDFTALAGPLEQAARSPLLRAAEALLRPLMDAAVPPPHAPAEDTP